MKNTSWQKNDTKLSGGSDYVWNVRQPKVLKAEVAIFTYVLKIPK